MTTIVALLSLLVSPAAATPAAMSATLEALSSQAALDPAGAPTRENARAKSGDGFDGFTISSLEPVEFVPVDGTRRAPPPPAEETRSAAPKPPASASDGGTYYFEGKSPVDGITLYTPKKDETGDGATGGGGESPTDKFGAYGKIAVGVGVALGVAGLVLGGGWLAPLALVAGLLIGAGAVLSFLFGKKKK